VIKLSKKVILSGIVGGAFSAFLTYLVVTYVLEKGISARRMMGINAICGGLGSAFASMVIRDKKQSINDLILNKIKELPAGSDEALTLIKALTPTETP
jgi:ABC-type uncharacterized transport system permease subunit